MLYEGQAITVSVTDGTAQLVFDAKGESVNKFDRATLAELRAATDALKAAEGVTGLVVFVGADITEFGQAFAGGEELVLTWLAEANAIFNDIEDLPYPSVTAINGTALGGGFEMCLATDYRVMSTKAQIGLPRRSSASSPASAAPSGCRGSSAPTTRSSGSRWART